MISNNRLDVLTRDVGLKTGPALFTSVATGRGVRITTNTSRGAGLNVSHNNVGNSLCTEIGIESMLASKQDIYQPERFRIIQHE